MSPKERKTWDKMVNNKKKQRAYTSAVEAIRAETADPGAANVMLTQLRAYYAKHEPGGVPEDAIQARPLAPCWGAARSGRRETRREP